MSFLETSHVAEGPFGSSDPLADLVEYFRTNGYEVVDSTSGPRPSIMTWKTETEGDRGTAEPTKSDEPSENTPIVAQEDAAQDPAQEDAAQAGPAQEDPAQEDADDDNAVETPVLAPENDDESVAETSDDSSKNEEILLRAQLRRGKQGASIWSSNMAELLADVDLKVIGNSVRIAYKIETTFQHFNDDDNAFWAHEAKQALRMASGGKAVDWRDNEEIRVSRQQKDIIMIGLQLAVLAAIMVAITYFAFNRS